MNSGTTFGALKPLSEYKGPILKLTKADKEKNCKIRKTNCAVRYRNDEIK